VFGSIRFFMSLRRGWKVPDLELCQLDSEQLGGVKEQRFAKREIER
jgi:hypothetical protein